MRAPSKAIPPTTETPIIKPVWSPLLLELDAVLCVAEAAGAVLEDVTAESVCVMTTVDPAESVVLDNTLAELVTVAVDWYEVIAGVARWVLEVVGVNIDCDGDDEVVETWAAEDEDDGAAEDEEDDGAAEEELADVGVLSVLPVLSVGLPAGKIPNCLGISLFNLRTISGLFWAGDAWCAEAAATSKHNRGTLALMLDW